MDLTPDEQSLFDDLAGRARELDQQDGQLEHPPRELWDAIEQAVSSPDVDAPMVPDSSGHSRPLIWLLGAAALLLLVALGGWLLVSKTSESVVGRTDLLALDETGAVVGDARLIDVNGVLRLQIETEELDPGEGRYLEVWVIGPDLTELISLGPVRPDGSYDLPPGVDPERFPVVDISREPLNGDPTHSGDSLVQGQLAFA